MDYHSVTNKIITLLEKEGVWFETFEHQPVRTSEEAARVRPGYSIDQGAKAMIVRVKKRGGGKFFAILVVPANEKFDSAKVRKLFDTKSIRFASENEVKDITGGIKPGGVPPFGNLFGLKVIVDPKLFENEGIVFNAGDRRFSVAMKASDYKKLVNPSIREIV